MAEEHWYSPDTSGTGVKEGYGERSSGSFFSAPDEGFEGGIDLNRQLIRNTSATFFFRMNSDAMTEAGIFSGDILVVDRSVKAVSGKVIVAVVNGELLVRRLQTHIKGATLVADNSRYGNIQIDEFCNYAAWGVVTYAIHAV